VGPRGIHQPWEPEERDILTKLWEKGTSVREITQVLGRSEASLQSKITSMGLRMQARPTIDRALLKLLMGGETDEI